MKEKGITESLVQQQDVPCICWKIQLVTMSMVMPMVFMVMHGLDQ